MARRTQGTSAGLTRERIAAAAVALVDRDGLERFGVRRLADELGVDPMSIYNHIKGKAALLDAVSEAVLAEMATDTADGPDTWEEIARATAHTYRRIGYRHPHVVPLLATRPQTSPAALTALERLVTAMRTARLPDHVISDTPLVLFGFLNGYLLAVLSGEPDRAAPVPAFDPALYPTMATLAPRMTDFGSVTEFDRLLDTVLAGIRDRAAGAAPR
ncbi:TetR/AcrR family transcriptional regulator C-terminal domain-containing protein [Nocardia terpenica]|uniref:TetR/AcrR family transcriptional regulator n=1 Tax=Nocardia terpenica TaxID=455432 RepID=UPI0018951E8D|nr:TetR/AcrR family transcriptional regulator C-terminal domain-containing protein [Nocardia terpenica]MBF6059182.1 TetR/AcrR family transcriptional regulator C-terminal domain-containing protein [Nocardia terpenica]MBF6103279.1 TetR/AcrR family transcriptional regulator C-terminal domain-containing protein [Nocardia terpenica]MBF6110532.1 TetR/AcrR family transcriptional regulator C-terminal domain-containing protein [Nocardia terpenica]MBF6116663.1 TetR/AcrR family transcriptional regulator C